MNFPEGIYIRFTSRCKSRLVHGVIIHEQINEYHYPAADKEITGKAKTSFPFDTFNLTPPTLYFILSVEDNKRLELDFVASIANES